MILRVMTHQIECKVCAEKYYFKRVMRWDPWTGAYWDEWKIQEK